MEHLNLGALLTCQIQHFQKKSSPCPSILMKHTPSHVFSITVNGITASPATSQSSQISLPSYLPYPLSILNSASHSSRSPQYCPDLFTSISHHHLTLSSLLLVFTFRCHFHPPAQIILLMSRYNHITPLLKILQLPAIIRIKSELP